MKNEEFYIKGCISASKFMEDRDFKLPKDSFIVNEKYDCFVEEDYGAWMNDVNNSEAIDSSLYKEYFDDGYDIVLGPPSNKNSIYGVYCRNYKEVARPKGSMFDNDNDYLNYLTYLDYLDSFNFEDSNTPNNIDDFTESTSDNYIDHETFLEPDELDELEDKSNLPIPVDKPVEKKPKLKDINEVIKNVQRKFIGQEEAIEDIVTNIYANQIIIDKNPKLLETQKASILIDGPTGTGKTAIMKEIAKELNVPIIITSATRYSQTGYVGDSIDSILMKLVDLAGGNIKLAERGIICFDEIDKLGYDKDSYKTDNMHESVQEEILSYMSGEKIKVKDGLKSLEFDTTNTTFIGMGAFTDLREYKMKYGSIDKGEPTIGFNAPIRSKKDKKYTITEEDYIDYGLKRELVGRFTLQTYTRAYKKEDYINILKNSEISPIKQFEEFAHTLGIENVIYDDEFLDELSRQAYDDNFGARGLQKIVNDLKNVLLLDMINAKEKNITLTSEMIKKGKEKNIRSY